ncbi:hypothetical protein V2A60_005467 [Cordyceps javanica]
MFTEKSANDVVAHARPTDPAPPPPSSSPLTRNDAPGYSLPPLPVRHDPEQGGASSGGDDACDVYKSPPPDGGLAAWLALLSSWCMLFCTFGMINCIGTFQGYYQEVYLREYSPGTISWIPSLQIFIAYVTNPLTGRLYDVYGPRALVAGGTLLEVGGLASASLATRYWQILLSQGLCASLGMSALYVPATALVAGWFGRRRGLAYGLATSGSSLGGVALPVLLARLVPRVGFPWALRAACLVVLALLLVANATVRARLPPSPAPLSRRVLLGPFREAKLALVNVGFLLMTLGVFIPINYMAVESRGHGMPEAQGHYLVAAMNAGSLVGRVGAGLVADRVGAYNTFVAVSALAGVLVLALYVPAASPAAVWAFSALFGCTSGAYIALLAPLVVKISPLEESGYRIGLLFALSSVSGLVTSPVGGAILERWGGDDYTGMKIYSGVMMLSGAALVFVSRMMATGWKMNAIF